MLTENKIFDLQLGILPGETVRIKLAFQNTLKKRRFKKRTQKYALLSLCQQLDFCSQSTSDPCSYARKSVTIAVHSQVRFCKRNQCSMRAANVLFKGRVQDNAGRRRNYALRRV